MKKSSKKTDEQPKTTQPRPLDMESTVDALSFYIPPRDRAFYGLGA